MSWIQTIAYSQSTGRLRKLYDRISGPGNNVDNIMIAHSLRPHTMEGHMAIYKYVLHHSGNTLEKWYLELIGVWVSLLNECEYCERHHFAGLQRLLDDDDKAMRIKAALDARQPNHAPLTERQIAGLAYAEKLTCAPASMAASDVPTLRAAGFSDGEILEINQVTAYFCYANRTVLGLGVSMEGDIPGLSPGNTQDPSDWSHS